MVEILSPKEIKNRLITSIDIAPKTVASKKHPQRNEDTYFLNDNGSFGIFDGAGGESNGQESSQFCSQLIQKQLRSLSSNYSISAARQKLVEVTQSASQAFVKNASKFRLGASTAVFGLICVDSKDQASAVIANIGDSRAYLFRPNNADRLIVLTTDDNILKVKNSLLKEKYTEIQKKFDEVKSSAELSKKELDFFYQRNIISNCFSRSPTLSQPSQIVTVNLQPDDILLLTTDGVHDNLTTTELSSILFDHQHHPSSAITKEIIRQSTLRSEEGSFRSKHDDMTAIVFKCSS